MAFKVVRNPKGSGFKVKNTTTGKIGKDNFKSKKNADIQVRNRYRFIKLMKKKNSN